MVLRIALRFLGLDPHALDIGAVTSRRFNSAAETPGGSGENWTLQPNLVQELRDIFRPYNDALEKQFGVDVADW